MRKLELRKRRAQLRKSSTNWTLLPGPQIEAADTLAFETLYGGEAGGGKSELVAWLARHRHRNSLVLRRTFPELKRTLIPRALTRYGDPRYYNISEHVWRWPSGQRIEFGYLDTDKDVYNYQGAEFDGFFPDELTQFPREWYLYIFSRLRTTERGQRVRVVATSNPGGEYEAWVKERWAPWLDRTHPNPAKSGELRYFKQVGDRDVETTVDDSKAVSRTFIRAGLKDNPYLGEDYRQRLEMLPEPWRSQYMNGDWNAGAVDDGRQVIPTAWIELAMRRSVGWVDEGDVIHPPVPRPAAKLRALGVDVARGGKDKTVFAPVYESWFAPLVKFPGADTPDGIVIAANVGSLSVTHGHVVDEDVDIKVDIIGVGSSPADILRQNNYRVVPMNGSMASDARDRSKHFGFLNKRAEWYWRFREALDPNTGDNVVLPDDPELKADLAAARWEERSGKIKIEAKEDIVARLGRSPDCGDSVVMAHAQESATGANALVDFYGALLKQHGKK